MYNSRHPPPKKDLLIPVNIIASDSSRSFHELQYPPDDRHPNYQNLNVEKQANYLHWIKKKSLSLPMPSLVLFSGIYAFRTTFMNMWVYSHGILFAAE